MFSRPFGTGVPPAPGCPDSALFLPLSFPSPLPLPLSFPLAGAAVPPELPRSPLALPYFVCAATWALRFSIVRSREKILSRASVR